MEDSAIAKAVIESRKPLIIHDRAKYSVWPSVRVMLKSRLQGTIACPLIIRNNLLGSLHLSFKKTPSNINELARCIHNFSPRKDAMIVIISCPALASSLFESDLFGHAKGAFTGAHAKRIGHFEMANGGTVFLDEIGELPVSLQAKLLQVLQDKTFERVVDSNPTRINFRIIAATNKTTEQLTSENSFRSDLFYRINTVSLTVPPLRERVQDIPILIEKLNVVESETHNRPAPRHASSAMELLCQYSWPGNVRELKNLVKRMIILYPDEIMISVLAFLGIKILEARS